VKSTASTSKKEAWKKEVGKLHSGSLEVSNLNIGREGFRCKLKVSQYWTSNPNLKSKVIA
jgi:hypothetical protein